MKAIITITFEYEMKSDWYPEGISPEEWLAIDLANFKADPIEALLGNDFTMTGELID